MRTSRIAVAILVLGSLTAVGCKNQGDATSDLPRPSKAFCVAAGRYDDRITTKHLPINGHITMVEKIAANAPPDVARDARTFLDALRRRAAGDTSVVDDPKVETAMNNVLRRAGQDCGWYQQKSSI
jgi:hypothetical protein